MAIGAKGLKIDSMTLQGEKKSPVKIQGLFCYDH